MAEEDIKKAGSVLGDIMPEESDHDSVPDSAPDSRALPADKDIKSMHDGSHKDGSRHAGSRDVADGGGTGAETGGTRNYRQGTGATGGDVGNRPE